MLLGFESKIANFSDFAKKSRNRFDSKRARFIDYCLFLFEYSSVRGECYANDEE